MRLKDIINEKLFTVLEVPSKGKNGRFLQKVQIFENSSLSEFVTMLDRWKQMRGMTNKTDFYIFDAHFQHHFEVANQLGLDITEFLIWETADDIDGPIRNIQVTNSVYTKYRDFDDYTLFEFLCNHPTFGRIAKSGRFTFFDSHLSPDE